jgi:hypothetical protein
MTVKSWKRLTLSLSAIVPPTVVAAAVWFFSPGDQPRTALLLFVLVAGGLYVAIAAHTCSRIINGWVRCLNCRALLRREREFETKTHSYGRCERCGSLYELEKKT